MRKVTGLISAIGFIATALLSQISQAAEADWITLIDGTNGIENFDKLGDANWSAVDGAIQATAGSAASFLVTRENYGDFTLRVEFWATDDANSGIFLRCQEPTNINDRNCYEANIFDQRPDPVYGTGGIVHIGPVSEPRPMAGGKWNTYEITLQGPQLLVVLNGQTTVDIQDSQFTSGPVALQWGRGTIRFRKVEVRTLQP
ncbi:MAG: DUF1080 domain-containing protein [Pseudohongiellaceae bacterium]